ncbi:MAG: PKD domain-containing protein [Bacteroidota bacterium]|nr:PKD domain-containing protein [Bacteroidota bacterium]MDP3146705.1 PKD domain-containing protein [Bacteroidota bacterium]
MTVFIGLTNSCTKPTEGCFTYTPTTITTNTEVTFNAACSENGYSFIWNFGDGTADTTVINSLTVTHKYSSSGTYIVTMTAERKDGVSIRKGKPTMTQSLTVQ